MTEPNLNPSGSKSRRRLFGAAIVLFWLAMMGLLAQREFGGRKVTAAAATTEGPRRPAPQTLFLALELATGERVGLFQMAQASERRQDRDGIRTTLQARVALDLLGKRSDLRLKGTLWQGGDRAELKAVARSNDTNFHVEGKLEDGRLEAVLDTAGEKVPFSLQLGRELFLDSGLGAALRFPTCTEGETLRFDSFDPMTLSSTTARVECLGEQDLFLAGETIRARQLRVHSGGLESIAFVDEGGNVVRAETPFGFVLVKISAQEALEPLSEAPQAGSVDGPGWLGLTAVKPTGTPPFRDAGRLLLRVTGGPEPPQDDSQRRLPDGSFEVVAGRLEGLASVPPSGAELEPYLRSEPLLQSDHPRLREAARQIVGTETDPARQARLLHDWIFIRLEKEPVLSLPSALEVLERRRGDCNEHAVLYTALARALGLPSRVAVGLVWSDEHQGFFYHAWPEVLLAPGWQRFDPTLDQAVADATHIKLLDGGIESWPQLLPFLGRLKIEILAAERGAEEVVKKP